MLGMICIDKNPRRLMRGYYIERDADLRIYRLYIKKDRARFFRRGLLKLTRLGASRVIIPDNFSYADICTKYGQIPVYPDSIYPKIGAQIILHAIEQFHIKKSELCAVVSGGRFGADVLETITEIARNVKYLSLQCSGREELCRILNERLGISVLSAPPPDTLYKARIDIQLSMDQFKMEIITEDGLRHRFCSAEIILPERYINSVPEEYHKSFACAYLQGGLLRQAEVRINEVKFDT